MRKHITSLISIVLVFTFVNLSQLTAQPPKDFAVMASVTTEKGLQPAITISWPANPNNKQMTILRKSKGSQKWGDPIAQIEGDILSFTDTNVEIGTAYEYWLVTNSENSNGKKYSATGYLYAGIDVKSKDAYGKVLLLVDETIVESLTMEINRLTDDMTSEGWAVVRRDVPRTEDFDVAEVKKIKNIIYDVKDSSNGT